MKKSEQPRGLLYQLQEVPWDWFGTFTFGLHKRPDPEALGRFLVSSKRPPSRVVRYSIFFQWLRSHFEKAAGLKKTIFVLRHERGEIGQRPHFHFLMVVPPGMDTISQRFRMMAAWENLGGGFARIRSCHHKSGHLGEVFAHYVTKRCETGHGGFGSSGADKYESNKFEQSEWEDLKLSPALIQFLSDR